MATSWTITGDTPDLLKPFLESFQAARAAMQEEMTKDPVPEVSCDQIVETTKWLTSVIQAMNEHNEGFSRLTLSTLSDDELHRNQALARESSRQLTLLFADKSKHFSATSDYQLTEFGMGSQSQEIRENLSKFSRFLEHFSQAKWLGDLVAPEFVEQKDLAVKILNDLQTGTQLQLPECFESKPTYCNRCGQTAVKTKGFCNSCNYCQCGHVKHNYPNGCPNSCWQQGLQYCNYCNQNRRTPGGFCTYCGHCAHGYGSPCPNGCSSGATVTISPKPASSLYEGLEVGDTSLEKLETLVKMSEALAQAFRKDIEAQKAQKDLTKKMKLLKSFAEAVNDVPEVLRRFLLIRAGSISDISELKAWVSQEEADKVHKMLEEFRDEVNEEKVLRRVNVKRASSEGSWSYLSEAPGQRP